MIVALYGASGFVGSAVREELSACAEVINVTAPRLSTSNHTVEDLRNEALRIEHFLPETCDLIVNAAGLAAPTSPESRPLIGANALLPLVLARVAKNTRQSRLIHVSSAAVQGRAPTLDESARWFPETAYAHSKALGEEALLSLDDIDLTILRPTSVHGTGRRVTERLREIAKSPFAAVATPGTDPTPQVHVATVARAVREIVSRDSTPRIALQPSEGMTTAHFLELLGGKPPRIVPRAVARGAVHSAYLAARTVHRFGAVGQARRAEMLLFGQCQQPGWLDGIGAGLTTLSPRWQELAA